MFLFGRTFRYIFSDLIPIFVLGNLVFVFILLMFQVLRLTEFVLVHGVPLTQVLNIMIYLAISFLPAILPMSLLFAVLMTYGRLSNDSEITAFKAVGVSNFQVILPAIVLGFCVTFLASKIAFDLAPQGNRNFELTVDDVGSKRAAISLREGTFSEGFFEMVIYANKVDSKTGLLDNVFIYDERKPDLPVTIIASQGQILTDNKAPGQFALLRLKDGSIHRKAESHTRIQFDSYDMRLAEHVQTSKRKKSMQSLTLAEIGNRLENAQLSEKARLKLESEYHKRWAVSFACIVFALIGVGFGLVPNKRSAKTGGFVLSIVLIVLYWITYVLCENVARQGIVPTGIAIWSPNGIFTSVAFFFMWRNKN